jgi:hypothetical protein
VCPVCLRSYGDRAFVAVVVGPDMGVELTWRVCLFCAPLIEAWRAKP